MGHRAQVSGPLAATWFRGRRQFSPAQVLVLCFTGLIVSGGILLRLPISAAREPLTLLDALFTATSAVCVTGLIFSEREMAIRIAHSLVPPKAIDYIELSREFSIVEVPAPVAFVGRTLKQLELRPRLGLTLIAIKRQADDSAAVVTNIAPAADEAIRAGDILALLGGNEKLNQLDQLLSQ